MLKTLNLVIVAVSVLSLGIFLTIVSLSGEEGPWSVRGKAIRINADNYTLARLAREINDPEILAYDAGKRQALAKASLVVYGSFQIGDPDDPKLGETLLLDTVVCGDLRLEVARGGTLKVYHSLVQTVSQIITAETCSKGYGLIVDGTLEVADSQFLYMSGTQSRTARRTATIKLKRADFCLSDGTSFHTVDADGARVSIEDSKFRCEGQYGFYVEGSSGAAIPLRRCLLFGKTHDVFLTGWRPKIDLVDCQFSRHKIFFQGPSGRATIRWAVTAKVVEKGSGRPLPGIEVLATSTGQGEPETVRGRTAEDGTCRLVLTEYAATPDLPHRENGSNNVTPHDIVARSSSGAVLAQVRAYDASGSFGTVTLEVPSATLSSR